MINAYIPGEFYTLKYWLKEVIQNPSFWEIKFFQEWQKCINEWDSPKLNPNNDIISLETVFCKMILDQTTFSTDTLTSKQTVSEHHCYKQCHL